MNFKVWAMIILALALFSGCMTYNFVDRKGRDCQGTLFLFVFSWDRCEKTVTTT